MRYNGVEVPDPPLYTEVSLNPEDAHDNLKWSVVLLLRILSPASPNSIDTVGTGGVDGEAQPRILIKIRSGLNYLLEGGIESGGVLIEQNGNLLIRYEIHLWEVQNKIIRYENLNREGEYETLKGIEMNDRYNMKKETEEGDEEEDVCLEKQKNKNDM